MFMSKREKSNELTTQLQESEREHVISSNSSLRQDSSFDVPYIEVTDSKSSTQKQQDAKRTPKNNRSLSLGNSSSPLEPNIESSQNADNDNNINSNSNNCSSTCGSTEIFRLSPLRRFKTELKDLAADLIEYGKAKTWKKKILTVIFCLISMLVFFDLLFGRQDFIITWLHSFIVWMTTHHTAAVFAFVGIFVVSTLAFVPPTLLVFGAGYAFTMAMDDVLVGVIAAAISCFMGSCIGAIVAFLRSRYLMRDLVKLFANRYPLVRSIDQALKVNHGFWIMLLLRLCPIIPFNGLNYCCGITGVSLHDFTLSLVGIVPFQIYTIILGATAGAIELQNLKNDEYTQTERYAFIGFVIIGIIFGLVAIVYAWRLVKQELRRELNLSTQELERVVNNEGLLSSQSFDLHECESPMHNREIANESNEKSTPLQKDEEWFWLWA
eukprot:CAMPEP_0197179884 /NCGR_PEP_ID=MMETSP1423-20130617/4691_1 /TAXON_ID=476441 /ORGANISM="Pseudo-nitzschia heimii, Strain UNC1101" /LENGTH=437 /DNA_ID=CAMNT_0042629871 /DNA_START=250 /DNA_END=1563 /DNA_ORIENTATION=+